MFRKTVLSAFIISAAFFSLSPIANAQMQPEMQQAFDALEASLPGTLINNPLDVDWEMYGEDYRAMVVKADIPGGNAYRIRVKKAKDKSWKISANAPVINGVKAGDGVLLVFWGRARKFDKNSGTSTVNVELHQIDEPYHSVAGDEVVLNQHWQLHHISRTAEKSFTADEMGVGFSFGDLKQTIEIGQFYVMNLGQNADLSIYPHGSIDPK